MSEMHNRRNAQQCNAIADTIYICGECKFSFKNKEESQEHPEACETTDNETYNVENTCCKCGNTFLTSDLLNTHTRHHIIAKGLLICQTCNWNSKSQRELSYHVREARKQERQKQSLFNCDLCGDSYTSWGNLYTHMDMGHLRGNWRCKKDTT